MCLATRSEIAFHLFNPRCCNPGCSFQNGPLNSHPKMEDENSLIAQRREKLMALQAQGVNPFGHAYETSGTIAEARAKFSDGATLRIAGRITAHRDMGKSHFVDLR